jgi:hypothetical protein
METAIREGAQFACERTCSSKVRLFVVTRDPLDWLPDRGVGSRRHPRGAWPAVCDGVAGCDAVPGRRPRGRLP